MKASILGGDQNILCQVPHLREAFARLGHEHTSNIDEAFFVFVGDPPYEPYLSNPKTIFNVLDIPWHVPEIRSIVDKMRVELPKASRVTTISKTVAKDLIEYVGVKPDVIYYPMKPVRYTGEKTLPHKVALIGRLRDPNKRARVAVSMLMEAGYQSHEVAVVGPEDILWGDYLGQISDEKLNEVYNSVDYVLMTSHVEGIGLPAIEGAVCGAIPIVLPDLTTFNEFWVESPLGLHYQGIKSVVDGANLIKSIDENPKWKDEIKQDLLGWGELFLRPKFDADAVIRRIIDVYHSI